MNSIVCFTFFLILTLCISVCVLCAVGLCVEFLYNLYNKRLQLLGNGRIMKIQHRRISVQAVFTKNLQRAKNFYSLATLACNLHQ